MFYKQRAIYVHLGCQVLLVISSFHTWYGPSHHPHRQRLTPTAPLRPPLPSPWSCPLPGFRLMTSDSPLRGASCLQSAVRLLVIIFQSVTLVSALWRCEEERGRRPWLPGWLRRRSAVGTLCVCVCGMKRRRWRRRRWNRPSLRFARRLLVMLHDRVSVLKRHSVCWMCLRVQSVMFFTSMLSLQGPMRFLFYNRCWLHQ